MNYKLVNFTLVSRKLMEATVLKSIYKHMKDKNVIGNSWHGFTKEKSCLINLAALYNVTHSFGCLNSVWHSLLMHTGFLAHLLDFLWLQWVLSSALIIPVLLFSLQPHVIGFFQADLWRNCYEWVLRDHLKNHWQRYQ